MSVLNFRLSLMTSLNVFNLGENYMVVDAIFNQLFESKHDVYAEDEFSVDGELIYSLPPLDEVWLSEPEDHDRREKMHAQHCRHEEHLNCC